VPPEAALRVARRLAHEGLTTPEPFAAFLAVVAQGDCVEEVNEPIGRLGTPIDQNRSTVFCRSRESCCRTTDFEPAGGLEPPTPCLQDLVHAQRPHELTCENTPAILPFG
jgi:hypothetical protein